MLKYVALVSVICLTLGCAGSTGFLSNTIESSAQLGSKNFVVAKAGIAGTASCWYIIPGIPLGDLELYKNAMADLRKNIGFEKKSITLVNITEDKSEYFLILAWRKQVTITADVVEFSE